MCCETGDPTVPALAQTTSATTATVLGTVADSSGGSLPGVTVTLTGTSMMGVQTAVTVEDGGYWFISVPPGEYKLAFELPGFSTVTREGIRLAGACVPLGELIRYFLGFANPSSD